MADVDEIRAGWDQAARADAMFNIVTLPEKAHGGRAPDELFAHAQAEIDPMIRRVRRLQLLRRSDRALDFGCGVGRLTQALTMYFKRVTGVDVSAEMVTRARGLNQCGDRVEYLHTGARLLDTLEPGLFDLIY